MFAGPGGDPLTIDEALIVDAILERLALIEREITDAGKAYQNRDLDHFGLLDGLVWQLAVAGD